MKKTSCHLSGKGRSIVILLILATAGFSDGATLQFRAALTPGVVVFDDPFDDPGASQASGVATFTLTTGGVDGPQLSYTLSLDGLTFDTELPRASSTGAPTLVRAVHIHFGAIGTNNVHALNIYGVPREDDGEISVSLNSLSGNWDDSDENFGTDGVREAADSVALTDAITALQSSGLYVQVHTFAFRDGELRGQIVAVPEPSAFSLAALFAVLSVFVRHRRQ